MTNTEAPKYLARDTYKGTYWRTTKDASKIGLRSAGWIADNYGDRGEIIMWTYVTEERGGVHVFGRDRYVAHEGKLYGYDSDGALKIVHPADRKLRFLSA